MNSKVEVYKGNNYRGTGGNHRGTGRGHGWYRKNVGTKLSHHLGPGGPVMRRYNNRPWPNTSWPLLKYSWPTQYSNVPYSNVPYSNVPYSNVPYSNVPYSTVQFTAPWQRRYALTKDIYGRWIRILL